jgi:hypothetical protein
MKPTVKCLVWAGSAVLGLALVWGCAPFLHADEGDGAGQSGRAVRLSSVDGQVQLLQGGQLLTDQAIANTPLFEGTQITTGSAGRAELQFDDGSVARIPPASSVTLSMLRTGGETEVVLSNGMGYFELQGGSQGSPMRVRFGSNSVTASGFTVIRVKLDDGPATVAVFSGNARLEGESGGVDLHGGESISLNGPNASDSAVAESIEPDSWDAWNADRDQALTASETASTDADKNLPQSSNPAWGDLNTNGTWYNVPDQGNIWSPYEASNPGWDPYGTGNWMWTPGYGYVWVSGEPWGYMPYQCGAWNYYNSFGWGWAPGGCQTWWGGGGGEAGWYYTVGITPRWYKLPQRPGPPRPRSPITNHGLHPVGPAPYIPVNRRLPLEGGPSLPPRGGSTPVMISGTVARPLSPEPARPVYGHQLPPGSRTMGAPQQNGNRPENGIQPSYPRPVEPGAERGNWPASRPAPAPRAPQPSGGSRPSYGGGGGGGRSSPPPAPSHSSSPAPAPAPGHPK